MSGSGMGLLVGSAETVGGDVGVDLRGRHGRVAEKLLHAPKVGASFEQMRCGGVAEAVRRQVGSIDGTDPLVHETSYGSLIDPTATSTDEHRRTTAHPDQLWTGIVQPAIQRLGGRHAVRDRSFL